MKKTIFFIISILVILSCQKETVYKDIIEVEDGGISIAINETVTVLSEDDSTSISYSETSNIVSITGGNNDIKLNSILVLDLDTAGVLRKVISLDSSNNQINCETTQATMEDVFGNADFKLSTSLIQPETSLKNLNNNSEISKALTDYNGFIHPVEIIYHTKDGIITKSANDEIDGEFGDNLYTYKDFSGKELYSSNIVNFYISEGYAEFSPVFKFEFDFEKPSVDWESLEINKGELKRFKFWSDETKFDFKTMLTCNVSSQIEVEEIKKLFSNVIKTSFKFFVAGVPVYISIDCDIYGKYNLNFSSQLEATVGFQSTRYITLGVLYENNTWSRFSDYRKEDVFYPPQLSGQANLSQRLEIYPHFDVKLYKILGPNLDIIPFVYNENNVDIAGNWDAHLDLGIDLRIGAEVEVLGNSLLSYQSENINLYTNTVWESSGGNEMNLEVLLDNLEYPKALFLKDNMLYFTETAARSTSWGGKLTLNSYNLLTNEKEVLKDSPSNNDALVVIGNDIYLSSYKYSIPGDNGEVSKFDLATNTESYFMAIEIATEGMSVDESNNIYLLGSSDNSNAKSLYKFPASNYSQPEVLLTGLGRTWNITYGNDYIYFSDHNYIYKYDGVNTPTIFKTKSGILGMAISNNYLYYSSYFTNEVGRINLISKEDEILYSNISWPATMTFDESTKTLYLLTNGTEENECKDSKLIKITNIE